MTALSDDTAAASKDQIMVDEFGDLKPITDLLSLVEGFDGSTTTTYLHVY